MDFSSAEEAKSLGNNAFKNGDFETAIALYTRALELAERDGATEIAHLVHANRSAAACRLGDSEAALQDADAAVALKPDWPRGHQRRGAALLRLGRVRAAVDAYARAAALKPDDREVASGLADSRTALTAAERFLDPVGTAAAQGREHVTALLDTAGVGADAAVVARVVELGDEPALFSTADLLDSRLVDAFVVLSGGRDALDKELPSIAVLKEEESSKEDEVKDKEEEETVETLLEAAEKEVARGTLWEAAEVLERAAKVAPREARVYARLAAVYEKIGDMPRAVRWCRRGLVCCGASGDATDAVHAVLTRGVSHAGNKGDEQQQEEEDAAVLYAARLHLEPDARDSSDEGERYAATGRRLFGAGRTADAAACFAAAEATAAHCGARAQAGAWAGALAVALVRLQRPAEAVEAGERCCAARPHDVRAHVRLAWCLLQCHRTTDARTVLLRTLETHPGNSDCTALLHVLDAAAA